MPDNIFLDSSNKSIIGGLVSVDVEAGTNDICSISKSGICSQKEESELMKDYLKKEYNIDTPENAPIKTILKTLMDKLNIHDELKLWQDSPFSRAIGEKRANKVVEKIFKPVGPSTSTALLDNINIDSSLEQWAINGQKMFGKKFKHIPFQMIDFAKQGKELAYTKLKDLIDQKYDCFGVILNTDVSSGNGLHWFCLYGDFQHKGTQDDPYTLEYFNSSGNPPMYEVSTWMEKAVHDLKRDTGKICKIVRSIPRRIQYSNTECGVFSLIYILSRLEGKPISWFYQTNTDDEDMIRYRSVLFRK